jgi:hypothetical protein
MLAARIAELRQAFLPRRFSLTGDYRSSVHDRARGFRLLVHAEFESYIEDRALEVANSAIAAWSSNRALRPALIALAAFDDKSGWQDLSILNPASSRQAPDLVQRLNAAAGRYRTYLTRGNHGVKEKNLLRILMPLGIEASDIDTQWLAAIDSWATDRGDLAHKSKTKLSVLPDPQVELTRARYLRDGFLELDKLLDRQ